MACILVKKKNILVDFGEVKQTVNTPTTITILKNIANAPTAVAIGCLDQQEYSLKKTLYLNYDD
jgi:hypothetical protein